MQGAGAIDFANSKSTAARTTDEHLQVHVHSCIRTQRRGDHEHPWESLRMALGRTAVGAPQTGKTPEAPRIPVRTPLQSDMKRIPEARASNTARMMILQQQARPRRRQEEDTSAANTATKDTARGLSGTKHKQKRGQHEGTLTAGPVSAIGTPSGQLVSGLPWCLADAGSLAGFWQIRCPLFASA